MIKHGKKLGKHNLKSVANLYALSEKHCSKHVGGVYLPATVPLKDHMANYSINNAIVFEKDNTYVLWKERKLADHTYSYNERITDSIKVIQNGTITNHSSICFICKHKLKGIVNECKKPSYYNKTLMPHCNYDTTIPDTDIDLSKAIQVSTNMLSTSSPFASDRYFNEISFDMSTIAKNKALFKKRKQSGDTIKNKKLKYCSSCVFSCDNLNMDNCEDKCQLTYEQALKGGFFKDLKINYNHRSYYTNVYVGSPHTWANRLGTANTPTKLSNRYRQKGAK